MFLYLMNKILVIWLISIHIVSLTITLPVKITLILGIFIEANINNPKEYPIVYYKMNSKEELLITRIIEVKNE